MKNIIIIFMAVFLFPGCKNNPEKPEEHAHEEHTNGNEVSLSKAQMESIKIEFGNIEKKQLTTSLKANGILKVPNQNKANITAILGGVVQSILVQTGNTVKKGDVIATIANTGFISMQEEFLSVSSKTQLAELELSRQKEMQKENAGIMKNLQAAEAELKMLKARKSSLEKQLLLVGINASKLTTENIRSVVSVISPISGSVSEVMVNIGTYIGANNPIATVVDNSQLHLDLYVYEKDLLKLKSGQIIHFTLTNNPEKEYDALIYGISNTFEENTKAIAIHATVEGDKLGLIDGMSITALVSLENATVNAVPVNSIVSYEGKDYIFIVSPKKKHDEADGHGHDDKGHGEDVHGNDEGMVFEKILIKKGTTEIGYSEISLLEKIPENSKIVTNGAFFILAKMTNQGEAHEH